MKWWEDKSISLEDRLRSALRVGGGNSTVIGLCPDIDARYWGADQIEEMIQCLHDRLVCAQAGIDHLNPLENLAMHILMSSAGLEIPRKEKK